MLFALNAQHLRAAIPMFMTVIAGNNYPSLESCGIAFSIVRIKSNWHFHAACLAIVSVVPIAFHWRESWESDHCQPLFLRHLRKRLALKRNVSLVRPSICQALANDAFR
jgi:hypothetical protein